MSRKVRAQAITLALLESREGQQRIECASPS
jgi:hypothetical protein